MKNNFMRFIALGLVLTVLTLASCSVTESVSGDNTDESTSVSIDGSYSETETSRADTPDSLPDNLDFGGVKIVILARENEGNEFWDNEMEADNDGDVVNTAVYNRNLNVEERLNCDIDILYKEGNWNAVSEKFNGFIKSSILAGDNAFDIVAGYGSMMGYLSLDDCFANLVGVDYLDFTQPWWPEELVDELEINGQMYMIAGEAGLSAIKGVGCIFFNKSLNSEYNVADFYSLVNSHGWTFDSFEKAARSVSNDVNGNGEWDGGDIYSLANTGFDGFLSAFETPITTRDGDGYPVLDAYNEKIVDIFNCLWDLHWNNPASYNPYNVWQNIDVPQFSDGQVLFAFGSLRDAEKYRSMETDFGIIPYPLYDENQEDYHTQVADCSTMFALPADCRDTSFAGAVLEAIAAESYRSVTPAYFEVALNEKYTRDSESSQMLDILTGGIEYNFGYVYTLQLGFGGSLYRQIFQKNDNITSYYNSNKKLFENNFKKLLEYYYK